MRLFIIFEHDGSAGDIVSDMPWALDVVDEYTIESHGELPPEYAKKLTPDGTLRDRRQLIVEIPDSAVRKLFESPTVKGTIVE